MRTFLLLFSFLLLKFQAYSENFQVSMFGMKYGMFSNVHHVIGVLDSYDRDPFPLHVNFVGGLYYEKDQGSNWWEYYFEPIKI